MTILDKVMADRKKETTETFKVAVYGSLRKGLHNHSVLGKNAKFLGTFETPPEYSMYSIGGSFPGLKKNGTTSITMEVYEIDEDTFEQVNILEGYSEDGGEHNHYDRDIIKTPFGDAYGYIYNYGVEGLHFVASGDWAKYKEVNEFVNTAEC
jgi:gamma-glutamylcyclotransferase (GGCT)/AIG2-like uncharacterized protein YtfP